MEVKDEKDSMLVISRWLQNFNVEVWWNQKNEEFPVFHTTGKKRSDLLIKSNNQYYLIECKIASHKKNIYDAFFQLLNYSISDTKYTIDKKPVRLNGFLLATEHSLNGHLFEQKYEVLMGETDFGKSRMVAVNRGEIPRTEYSMTEAICRMLWRGIYEYNIECSIGVLLSNKLNNDILPYPLLLMKNKKQQYMQVLR